MTFVCRRSGAQGALLFAALCAAGCGGAIRSAAVDVPRAATPVVIDETLNQLEDEATRARIARIMASPELQETMRALASAVVPGALDGLSTDAARARIESLVGTVVAAIVRELTGQLRPQLSDAIAQGLSPEAQRALEGMATTIATSAVHGATHTAAIDIPTILGPSIRDTIVASLQAPEFREATAQISTDIARGAILGSREAVATMRSEQTGAGALDRLQNFLRLAGWATGLLITLFVALIAGGMLSLRARAVRAERLSEASLRKVRHLVGALAHAGSSSFNIDAVRESLETSDSEEQEPPDEPSPSPRWRRRRPRV